VSLKSELEVDIKRFFKQIENQNENDRVNTLRLLMDKYIHLSTSSYMMDNHDLNMIISHAKSLFANKTFPVYLGDSKKIVYENDQANLCVIESTISHLNNKDCLKKLPKFDYKENK